MCIRDRTYTTQDEDGTRTLLLSEFTANSDHTEWNDERVILAVEQESHLHYGGAVRFGPDGMLYMGFGDDGFLVPGDTRRQEAQNPLTSSPSLCQQASARRTLSRWGSPRGYCLYREITFEFSFFLAD